MMFATGVLYTRADNFNRANSTTDPNPASDGGVWDVSDNTGDMWGIDSNQLYRTIGGSLTTGGSASTANGPGGITDAPIIRTDAGSAAQDFSIDITPPNDVPFMGILLNYDPTARAAYLISIGSSNGATVTLWRCVGNAGADRTNLGTWTLTNPGTWPGAGGTSTIRAVHDGAGHITLYQGGMNLGTITDGSTPLTATWCGLQCNVSGTGGPHFDNFNLHGISDTFNTRAGTGSINPASDGGTWTIDGGTMALDGATPNEAALLNTTGGFTVDGQYLFRRDFGSNAVDMSIDNYRVIGTAPNSYLWIAYDPATQSGYRLQFNGTATADIERYESGSATVLGAGLTLTLWFNANWSTLRFIHDGAGGLTVYQDGVLIGSRTDGGTPLTGTWVAASSPGTGRDFWQNFSAVNV